MYMYIQGLVRYEMPVDFKRCKYMHPKSDGVAEWFSALDLKSGAPWFKSSALLPSGFVLGSPEFNSATALCK